MSSETYADAAYGQPTVPPAAPFAIDPDSSTGDAATLAEENGDSHAPGSQPAHFNRGREDERLFDGARGGGDTVDPGHQPDEIVPDEGDSDMPGETPDEVAPDQGDFDRPDSAPTELPPQPGATPGETPPPD